MSTDNREDYLINILRLSNGDSVVKTTELATYMGVSPASVTEMLKILQKDGLVNYEKYKGVSLTEKGCIEARTIRRKHHIMERFFTDMLDVDHQTAHDEAHAAEHAVSDETANRICRIIGPKVDCDCSTCTNPCGESDTSVVTVSLSNVESGFRGIISHLSSDDINTVKKLVSMGFVPGKEVEMNAKVSEKGARIIRLGDANFALDRELAAAIIVEVR